jgi:hypothetical protein
MNKDVRRLNPDGQPRCVEIAREEAAKKPPEKKLHYFSFYVIANKAHEEIETVLLRAAGPLITVRWLGARGN